MKILLLIAPIFAFLLTTMVIPSIIQLSKSKGLFDIPNERKIHRQPIPPLGGIAFFMGSWMAIVCFIDAALFDQLRYIMIGSFGLFFMSLKDDLVGMSPQIRLMAQVIIGFICYYSGCRIEGFYGFLGIEELSWWLSLPITILAICLLINAYNLIDGVNGLAGSLAILASLTFAWLFWQIGQTAWTLLALTFTGAVIGFLRYNFGKASIFMGDNGSTFIGLFLSILFIEYLNSGYHPIDNPNALLYGLGAIMIPAIDLCRVFFTRIASGTSPLLSDNKHIHHLLIKTGRSHRSVCFSIIGLFFVNMLVVTYLLSAISLSWSIIVMILMVLFFVTLIQWSLEISEIKSTERERRLIGRLH